MNRSRWWPLRPATLPLLVFLSGCAALFSPNPQPIPVDSRPAGADVLVNGAYHGTTPMTVHLDAREAVDIVLRLDGAERRITLTSSLSGTYVALDLVPGLAVAGASLWLGEAGVSGRYIDSMGELAAVMVAGGGLIVGVGSAAISVGVDATTRRWYRLNPTEIVVDFE